MRNTTELPIIALVLAAVLTIGVLISAAGEPGTLKVLELGAVAWAVGLAVFGVQGLISVFLEGRELQLGRVHPRLTGPLSLAVAVLSLVLFGIAIFLTVGLTSDWGVKALGALAGAGCLVLALLLVSYKEAFVGDEATLDDRDDGIPW